MSALRYGSQIVVGTPGRIKDHLERGSLVLSHLRICVLDEADQMLDSGFGPIVEEILATTPDTRQMAFFSATMPDWVNKLQEKFLKDPVKVAITPATGEQSTIEQIAYQVPHDQKMAALCTLLHSTEGGSSLIFGKTKFGVERLGKQLSKLGFTVGTLHGDKSQRAREEVLTAFRRGQVQTLLATNVAARGLDIQGISQVINYELPESSDLFTHRIGRTGRMGRQGKAITLLVPSDVPKWRRMARSLGQPVALQQLAIDEEAAMTPPPARPEVLVMQDYAQEHELRPVRERDRNHVSPDQQRNRRARPGQDRQMTPDLKRPKRERVVREIPAWESEDFSSSETPYSGEVKSGRRAGRDAGRPPRFDGTTGKRNARSYTATESQRPTARKKSGVSPSIRARRSATSKRAAGR
jgi:ATP-dependent RNA helicase DeaD